MEDRELLSLFRERNEEAIRECVRSYGPYCHTIAYRILASKQDAEEVMNDAFLKAWNRIPPDDPPQLLAYLAMLTRQAAIDRLRGMNRQKRGGREYERSLSELESCLPGENGETVSDSLALREAVNSFLRSLSRDKRVIFLRRYFYLSSVAEIARDFGMRESRVKIILLRTREKLRDYLQKEGLFQ